MLYKLTSLGTQLCQNFPHKSQPTQLKIVKPSEEYSHGSTKFPNQKLRQIGPGVLELLLDIRINGHTEITSLRR